MTNPTVPEEFRGTVHSDVFLGKHVIVGCASVILPGVRINEGAAIGAMSLVQKSCEAFEIYAGNPARRIKSRSKKLNELEMQLEIKNLKSD